jgi:hypothetical protein
MRLPVAMTLALAATAASAEDIEVGKKIPIPPNLATYVGVQIPVGDFGYGQTCQLRPRGELYVNMIAGESVVVRYAIQGELDASYCPTGMMTSIPVSFARQMILLHKQALDERWKDEWRRSQEQLDRIRKSRE